MYGFLDKLQEKAIYCDTDSVIFIQTGQGCEPTLIKTGDNLGQMQFELKKGEIILEESVLARKITRTRHVSD